jgi:cytochrome c
MPLDAPQSLTTEEVYSVVGYIYHLNGLVEADAKINGRR